MIWWWIILVCVWRISQTGVALAQTQSVPPSIIASSPKSFHQPLGSTVTVFCRADGSPAPTVSWTKDGRPVSLGQRVTMPGDGTEIVITNLQENDGGIFKCTFQNEVGLITQTIHLIVEGQAYIVGPPSNKTAVFGQRINFMCQAKGYPTNITYRWYKDSLNQNVNMLLGYGDRIQVIDRSGSLVIKMVEKIDMGWYYCRPSNGVGQDPEASAFLNVTYAPEVLKKNMQRSLIWALGFQEQLDCPVDANPPVTEIVWAKDGTRVIVDNFPHIQQLSNGSLLFTGVQTSDTGTYRCTAISSFGSGDSEVVQVEVKDPPRFTIQPEDQYIKQPAKSVVLPCAAAGTPTPAITWRKLEGTLEYDGRIQLIGGNLSIVGLQKTDHGVYECEASNEVAKIVISTEIIVQNTTPHAPYNITIEPGLFSATVNWLPAYSSSQQHYVIWYRMVINRIPASWQTMRVDPPSTTRFTIYNLSPDTAYQFKVLSRNHLGDGQFSVTMETRTMGNATHSPSQKQSGYMDGIGTTFPTDSAGSTYIPTIRQPIGPAPSRPVNVTVTSHSSGGLLVSWSPPLNSSVHIMYYAVDLSINGGEWKVVGETIIDPNTTFLYTPVKAGATYTFRVFSCGLLAYSKPSEVISFVIDEESGYKLSIKEIGGIIGGLLFLLVAVALAVIAVMCSRRREKARKRASKYDNVKYLGPADDIDASQPQYASEWSAYGPHDGGRGDVIAERPVVRGDSSGIFTTPQSLEIYPGHQTADNQWLYSGLYDGDHSFYDPSKTHETLQHPRSRSRSRSRSQEDQTRSRERSSHAWEKNHSLGRSERSLPYDDNGFNDENGFLPNKSRGSTRSRKRRRHRPRVNNSSDRFEEQGSFVRDSSGGHPDNSFHDNSFHPVSFHERVEPVSRTPPHSVHSPIVSPVRQDQGHAKHYLSYLGDDDEDEEVFMPPPISSVQPVRQGFPRHSSMKPSQQTYLTDDFTPSYGSPFMSPDLSSVLPSSVTDLTRDTYRPYQRQYSDLSPQVDTSRRIKEYDPQVRDSDHSSFIDHLDDTVVAAPGNGQRMGEFGRGISREESNSSDSSGRPVSYTRDQLHGVVERVRKGPRARKSRGPRGSGSELDSISESPLGSRGLTSPSMDDTLRPVLTVQDRPSRGSYRSDLDPVSVGDSRTSMSSSGLGSNSGRGRQMDSRSYGREDLTPDSISSGIGSRNTSSQLTGSSLHSRPVKTSGLDSSWASPRDWSEDSSPFPEYSPSVRRDVSGDENYEFDSANAVESDLLEALRNYTEVNSSNDELLSALETGLNSSQFYNELYPKPRRQSRYSDSEQRFEKLRGEFQKYREKQRARQSQYPNRQNSATYNPKVTESAASFGTMPDSWRYNKGPMDSDML